MAYELVALDIDGTLLNREGELTKRTEEVIRALQEQGVKVLLATGRRYPSALNIARRLGIELPIISHNGAVVFHVQEQKILYHRTLPQGPLVDLISEDQNSDIDYYLDCGDRILLTRQPRQEWGIQYIQNTRVEVEEITLQEMDGRAIHRLVVTGERTLVQSYLEKARQRMKKFHHILFTGQYYDLSFLELLEEGTSKGKALEYLARQWGIGRDKILAAGDEMNDLEMIVWAGRGLAMGNGVQALKEAADEVCGSNCQDGLAQALERLIL